MISRKKEKQFYIKAQDEYKNKETIDKAILAKAKTQCNSNTNLEGKYIELRVEDLKIQKKEGEEARKKAKEKAEKEAKEKAIKEAKEKAKKLREEAKQRQQEKKEETLLSNNDFISLQSKDGTYKYYYKTGKFITYTVDNKINILNLYDDFKVTINKCDAKPHYEGKVFNSFWQFKDFLKSELKM